jgi:hypothetical protein
MQYDSEYPSTDAGLCWYDGVNVGVFPSAPGGIPQWGGLPNSSINDLEVREIPGGYELWMSCLGRGIAVLQAITDPVGIKPDHTFEPGLSLSCYPNPLTSRTTLSFSQVDSGPISIAIYDINGKVVRDLKNTWYNSGTSSVEWEGHDNLGNRVIPGIYACRLIAGKFSKSVLIIVQ